MTILQENRFFGNPDHEKLVFVGTRNAGSTAFVASSVQPCSGIYAVSYIATGILRVFFGQSADHVQKYRSVLSYDMSMTLPLASVTNCIMQHYISNNQCNASTPYIDITVLGITISGNNPNPVAALAATADIAGSSANKIYLELVMNRGL